MGIDLQCIPIMTNVRVFLRDKQKKKYRITAWNLYDIADQLGEKHLHIEIDEDDD